MNLEYRTKILKTIFLKFLFLVTTIVSSLIIICIILFFIVPLFKTYNIIPAHVFVNGDELSIKSTRGNQ